MVWPGLSLQTIESWGEKKGFYHQVSEQNLLKQVERKDAFQIVDVTQCRNKTSVLES